MATLARPRGPRLLLALCLLSPAASFNPALSRHAAAARVTGRSAAQAKTRLEASGQGDLVVVVGRPEGTAASLAHRLSAQGLQVRACFHGLGGIAAPLPAGCEEAAGRRWDFCEAADPSAVASALRGAQHLVIACDGDMEEGGSGSGASGSFLDSLAQGLATGAGRGLSSVTCLCPGPEQPLFSEAAASKTEEDAYDGLLSGNALGESFSMPTMPTMPSLSNPFAGEGGEGGGDGTYAGVARAARSGGVRAVNMVKHGRVFGGIPGSIPVPFKGGALKVPVLDEHHAAQAVILSASDSILAARDTNPLGRVKVRTSRDALSEVVAKLLGSSSDGSASGQQEVRQVTVLSLDGARPTPGEWDEQFDRLNSKGGAGLALLRIDFDELTNPNAAFNWLTYDLGPPLLSSISTYTKRYGSRPVVVTPDETAPAGEKAVRVRWEDLNQQEMSTQVVGSLVVRLGPTGVEVTREGPAIGTSLSDPLPGEDEVLQRVVEGVEKNLYAKGIALRRGALKAKRAKEEVAAAQAAAAEAAAETKTEPFVEAAAEPEPKVPLEEPAAVKPAEEAKPRRKKRSKL